MEATQHATAIPFGGALLAIALRISQHYTLILSLAVDSLIISQKYPLLSMICTRYAVILVYLSG